MVDRGKYVSFLQKIVFVVVVVVVVVVPFVVVLRITQHTVVTTLKKE